MNNEQIVSAMLVTPHTANAVRRMAITLRTRRLRYILWCSSFVSAASCCGDRSEDRSLACVLEDVDASILREDQGCHYRYHKHLFKYTVRDSCLPKSL